MLTAVTALACLLAVIFGVVAYRDRVTPTATDPPEVVRLTVPAPNGEALPSSGADDGGVAVSPDGRYLTFTTISPQTNRRHLWVRALASLDVRALGETDDATWPFWSSCCFPRRCFSCAGAACIGSFRQRWPAGKKQDSSAAA